MGTVTKETLPAEGSVRSPAEFPPLTIDAAAAIGLVVEPEHWEMPALDPLVPASIDQLELPTVLHALSDPVRLRIVSQLASGGEQTCGKLDVPVAKSTCSHHFRVLREAGVVAQRVEGKCRFNRLRTDELEQRFPGLLDAVLLAQGPTVLAQGSALQAPGSTDPARA
jgi:DNA-binding transcriptional ArsR family regulator